MTDTLRIPPSRFKTLGELHNPPGRQIYFLKKRNTSSFDITGFELISGSTDKVLITGTTDRIIVKVESLMVDSEINALTAVAPAAADVVHVNDTSNANASRKATLSDILALYDSQSSTLTNKTFDANGTGNSITNIENADISTSAAIAITKIADGTAFQRIRTNSGATANEFFTENATIAFVIDGGGSAITTGVKGYIPVGFDCEIDRVEILADQTGSIVIDVWKDTYANYPPTDADSITASAVPTISSSNKDEDETLTGWTTAISQGDILGFNVDSATTITRATIALRVIKRG